MAVEEIASHSYVLRERQVFPIVQRVLTEGLKSACLLAGTSTCTKPMLGHRHAVQGLRRNSMQRMFLSVCCNHSRQQMQ